MYKDLDVRDKNYIAYVELQLKLILSNSPMEQILDNPNLEYVKHLILHRQAFSKVEHRTKYHGKFSNLHDIDKVGIALVLGKEETKRLHKVLAEHHNVKWELGEERLVEKVIDWESCHYSKLGEPDTAYEYLMKYHEDKVELMKPIMEELDVWEKHNLEPLTEEHYKQMEESLDMETILSEVTKSYKYFKTLV